MSNTIDTITDHDISEARKVLADHVVPVLNAESALESLIFCIASQGTPFEMASKVVYGLRQASYPGEKDANLKIARYDLLADAEKVDAIAKEVGWRFHGQGKDGMPSFHGNRFKDAIDAFAPLDWSWYKRIRGADVLLRDRYCRNSSKYKVKWLSNKTFSFWHLCLGGSNLLALDVHVMRGLSQMGVRMDKHFYIPKKREPSREQVQRVRKSPDRNEYLRLESAACRIFEKDSRFYTTDTDKLDLGLVDAYLWWRGARRDPTGQQWLFGAGSCGLPYAQEWGQERD